MANHVDIPAELVYRGADGGAVLPYRQHFKKRWPGGKEFVSTDLDQMLRKYSAGNPKGAYVKFEWKYVTFWRDIDPVEDQARPTWSTHEPMAHHQMRTLGLDDELCRKGDPEERHYRGLFLINWYEPDNDDDIAIVGAWRFRNDVGYRRVLCWPTGDEFDAYFMELTDPDRRER